MSRTVGLLAVLTVAVVGGGLWWLQQPTDGAGEGPAPVATPDAEPIVPRAPSMPRELTVPKAAPPPREAVASADDARIPVPTDWPGGLRVLIPDVPDSLEVSGEKVRDALVATEPLYL